MSATDIAKALPKLTDTQRRRARQLQAKIETLEVRLQTLLQEAGAETLAVNLQARGIDENHATDLRARLKTFAEDWERPEASIYDEDPAR